jgi:transposase-like protein
MRKRKRYNEEFEIQALKRADEPGVTDFLVAEELGVSSRQLRRWRDLYKA